ncbi:DUF927 domain-containing protein [Thiohalomonas denitrificans]|nr:DUF927 domain-containing protein [Thiohalomonas denitrificans]
MLGEKLMPPGLYWHGWGRGDDPEPIDFWICTPIHAIALTEGEYGNNHGLLLRFKTSSGAWREWAAPLSMLAGSGEEIRRELLDMGVRIDPSNRSYLSRWLMEQFPEPRMIAATRTGWHLDGKSFVLPQGTIGDDSVRYQSEHPEHDAYTRRGTLESWRTNVAEPCGDNPVLVLALSAAFSGPLLRLAKQQESGGAGIHFVGDSSLGKTTALQAAASVWGGPNYVRTWRATSNGMEGTAAALNDTFLPLDEISESDPRDVGSIIYALANGQGKQRANRAGRARKSARWRLVALSSGERSFAAHMGEAGRQPKAGQGARLLDLPVTDRAHGVFDELHQFANGRAFADAMKRATDQHHGHAGPAFVEHLLAHDRDLAEWWAGTSTLPGFQSESGIEGRAAAIFALVGMAGELATEYGITGWRAGEAMEAAIEAYQMWRRYRGDGLTEDRQILRNVQEFIARHGDSRFSAIHSSDSVRDRAGYWRDIGEERQWLLNSAGLKDAAPGFDPHRIADALDRAGWIVEREKGKRSKKVWLGGQSKRFYIIRPGSEEAL